MLFLLAMLADAPSDYVAAARARLAAERPCVASPDIADITVCGRRRADHFRVPFVTHDAGNPRRQPAMAERQALLHRTTPLQELSPFQVGGGMAGVRTTVGGDGTVIAGGLRPLAP